MNNPNKSNKFQHNREENKQKSDKKREVIVGDSTIKHVEGWETSKNFDDCNINVKNFPGAKVLCMKDFVKSSAREKPDHLILHVTTDDLDRDKSPEIIGKSVVDVARLLNEESIGVIISKLVKRINRFSEKAVQVNVSLKELCYE